MRTWLRRLDGAELFGVLLLAGFVFLVTAGPLAVSIGVSPEAIESGAVRLSPPCPMRARTGEGCGTCGLTRGFTAMSRLRLEEARAYNSGAPWIYLSFWAVALASGAVLGGVGLETASRRRARALAPA